MRLGNHTDIELRYPYFTGQICSVRGNTAKILLLWEIYTGTGVILSDRLIFSCESHLWSCWGRWGRNSEEKHKYGDAV